MQASRAAGVERLIHVSEAAATEDHRDRYMRTKALGDRAIREASLLFLIHL
jgi:uncharacterized protein YbjT (DUF2867 family)